METRNGFQVDFSKENRGNENAFIENDNFGSNNNQPSNLFKLNQKAENQWRYNATFAFLNGVLAFGFIERSFFIKLFCFIFVLILIRCVFAHCLFYLQNDFFPLVYVMMDVRRIQRISAAIW